jgi:hypothetical protein
MGSGLDWAALPGVLGAALLAAGFFFSSERLLRGLAAAGALLLFAYFLMRGGPAQWPGMAGTALIVAASLLWFLRAEQGQRQFKLTAEQMMLFARLPGLTPGQFKSLLDLASWSEPQTALQLTEEGKQPAALHYILEGTVDVNKKGKVFPLGPHAFVGELAFLRNKPATATVHARPGSLVVSWPADRLQALFQSDSGIRQAMSALLSADLAEKIARSDVPLLQEQSGGK